VNDAHTHPTNYFDYDNLFQKNSKKMKKVKFVPKHIVTGGTLKNTKTYNNLVYIIIYFDSENLLNSNNSKTHKKVKFVQKPIVTSTL